METNSGNLSGDLPVEDYLENGPETPSNGRKSPSNDNQPSNIPSPKSDTIGRPTSDSSATSDNIPNVVNTSLPKYFGSSHQSTEVIDNEQIKPMTDQMTPAIRISPDGTDDGSSSASISSKTHKMHIRQSSVLSSNSMALSTADSSSIGRRNFSIDHRLKSRLGSSMSTDQIPRRSIQISKSASKSHDIDLFMDPSNLSSPWEAMRWSKLRRLSTQLYSDNAVASYGRPTVVVPSTFILIGTSKGFVLVFDYHQTLLHALGEHQNVTEYGQIVSIAISSDDTSIAAGYESGYIVLWDLNRSSSMNLKINPVIHDFNDIPDTQGHLQGASILHIEFVNGKSNSLISADSKGMVFLHDTYRTMLGRSSRSRLILGKYPNKSSEQNSKTSVILACSSQLSPSGSDVVLTAIMTPYHLAIVSPLPQPQSQFKESRSNESNLSMGFSACLSWYSGFRNTRNGSSHTRLAYCWSNVCRILEVTYAHNRSDSIQLAFRSKKKYISDEPIVDVEWISSSLIAIVTVTQRLIIINEKTMNACATADLIDKHVMHYDNYSASMRNLSLPICHNGPKEPVIMTDDFTHCIQSYRSKLFILGKYEFVVGTLSTWADRLMNIIEAGDYVRAIQLATSFYVGDEDSILLGLPQDDEKRHEIVGNTMRDLIISCVRSGLHSLSENEDESSMREMADSCLIAACAIGDNEILDSLYESFENVNLSFIFIERLMKSIYDGEITTLPPGVFKKLIIFMTDSSGDVSLLEDVICRLDTSIMDLDLTLHLCQKYQLRDTEIYIWTTAFHDFINPLIDLLKSLKKDLENDRKSIISDKIYPFISYTLTGRVYPAGFLMTDEQMMDSAKNSVYEFLFFGKMEVIVGADGANRQVDESESGVHGTDKGLLDHTDDSSSRQDISAAQTGLQTELVDSQDELLDSSLASRDIPIKSSDFHVKSSSSHSKFPFISLLISYDSAAFFTALNEIFEDSYLNNNDDIMHNRSSTGKISISRQLIMDILMELFSEQNYGPEAVIYFDIFVARNYSKFSQFLILSAKQLDKILNDLCVLPTSDMKEECEIALQSLLSKYRPENIDHFITIFYENQYYMVLQYLYKARQKYADYLKVSFQLFSSMKSSTEVSNLFSIMSECLSNTMDYLRRKERTTIEQLIVERFEDLAKLDCSRLVELLDKFAPKLHETVLSLTDNPELQERYLREQFRITIESDNSTSNLPSMKARNLYISLLARNGEHEELHSLLKTALTGPDSIQLPAIVDDLIEFRSIDVLVELLCRQQRHSEAMIYLVNHILYLHDEYKSAIADIQDLESSFVYYVNIGVDICQGIKNDRNTMEKLWINLLDTLIQLSCDSVLSDNASSETIIELDDKKVAFERSLLENALSSLLGSSGGVAYQHDRSVISIFRTLLSNDSQNLRTVGVMRSILGDLFNAYRHQTVMLDVARQLLDKDNYDSLMELVDERLRGWRVAKSGECEGCGQKIVGVGIDASWLYDEWTEKEREELMRRVYGGDGANGGNWGMDKGDNGINRERKKGGGGYGGHGGGSQSGGAQSGGTQLNDTKGNKSGGFELPRDILVVFKCGHSYHLSCLNRLGVDIRGKLRCIICENEK